MRNPVALDYLVRWRDLVRARDEQGRRLDPQHNRPDHWGGERARRFRQMTESAVRSGRQDPFLDIITPFARADATVLDVGAGAGRHVAALAPLVRRVIAVEPSPAMRDQLADMVAERGLTNVEIVAGRWPEVATDPADLVICSHVVYFSEDLGSFLQGLRAKTLGHAFVVVRYEQRERNTLDLFEEIWGELRCPEPTFVDLFGAAVQIGIVPQVTSIPFAINPGFDNLDAVIPMIRAEILNPEGPNVDQRIRQYVSARSSERDGRWYWNAPPAHAGVLSWEGSNPCS
jgi:SAM-dependent methyltransferase